MLGFPPGRPQLPVQLRPQTRMATALRDPASAVQWKKRL
uniref:Zinc finger protein 211 n=1 Tax=Homo sapiens TaxID=9606 RepID=F5GY70_HUMAN